MIKIDLNLFATLNKFLPENSQGYEIQENMTVNELITSLEIPPDDVKLIFINGKKKDRSYTLQHGDRVGIFPPVGGG